MVLRRIKPIAVIPETKAHAVTLDCFQGKRDQLIFGEMISMPDDIGTGFIDAQDHQVNLSAGKSTMLQKLANTVPDQPKICWMTCELDLFVHLQPMSRIVRTSSGR